MKDLFSSAVSCVQDYLIASHRRAATELLFPITHDPSGDYSRVATIGSVVFIRGKTVLLLLLLLLYTWTMHAHHVLIHPLMITANAYTQHMHVPFRIPKPASVTLVHSSQISPDIFLSVLCCIAISMKLLTRFTLTSIHRVSTFVDAQCNVGVEKISNSGISQCQRCCVGPIKIGYFSRDYMCSA